MSISKVIVVGDAWQCALLDMFAGDKDWDGVGLAAEHAVAFAIAAMVGGDANEPVFIGERGDHEDGDGVGMAAEHAVAFAVAAMVAGDENHPVFVGEIRPCGDSVEHFADDGICLFGGVDVLLAVGVEAVRMAAVIDFTDEEPSGVCLQTF